jgi:Na+/H+ antiporter NhaD/arsenite permease-like protein
MDGADHRPVILAIFILTYVGLAIGRIPGLRLNRTGIAVLGSIAMMILSGDTSAQTLANVNWPTVLLLFGFFVLSAQLRLSGLYDLVARRISGRLDDPSRFLAYLILATAFLSAFLNNDIVCFVLTPVVCAALVRKKLNPVPFLIALAAASNVGAAGTLIGNAQNMMIGSVAGLSFARYMMWSSVPVVVGLAAIYGVTRLAGGGGSPRIDPELVEPTEPAYPLDRYHAGKGLFIMVVVVALFFTSIPREVTILVAAGIHLLSHKFRTEDILGLVDWQILVMFMSLFIVSGAFQGTGYGLRLVQWMEGLGFDPVKPANEAALTAGLSLLINNAPAVMLLVRILPLAHATTAYIMAVANSFAGNAIMTSSVANLIVIQQARKQGIVISFGSFARLGIPITLIGLAGLVAWATALEAAAG